MSLSFLICKMPSIHPPSLGLMRGMQMGRVLWTRFSVHIRLWRQLSTCPLKGRTQNHPGSSRQLRPQAAWLWAQEKHFTVLSTEKRGGMGPSPRPSCWAQAVRIHR